MPTKRDEEDDDEEQSLTSVLVSIDDDGQTVSRPENSCIKRTDFIHAVQTCPEFTDFFENLDCINVARQSDGSTEVDGATSVVFKALDAEEGRTVAVKVLDKSRMNIPCDDKLFEWESTILTLLKKKKHCQQLIIPYTSLMVKVNGNTVPTGYFATLYLRSDIRRFFYTESKPGGSDLTKKLLVFNSLLSAVKSLHAMGICHRDIKPENFRAYTKEGRSVVVAIDLGLALASETVQNQVRLYSPKGIGTQEYAAPEKLCGFENEYSLGKGADMYSLGCLLFELVSKDLFYEQFKQASGNCYGRIMNDSKVYGADGETPEELITVYNSYIDKYFFQLRLPQIAKNLGIPEHVRLQLQKLIEGLCCLDYRKRIPSEKIEDVKKEIRSIIAEIESGARYRKRCHAQKEPV